MHIYFLDFFASHLRSRLTTDGVAWNGESFVLEEGRSEGTILTPAEEIAPEWGHTFEGFEILPREVNVDVAIRHPRLGEYFKFYDFWSEATTLEEWGQIQLEQYPRWKPISSPVFYKPEDIRDLLSYWSGPLQLLLRLRLLAPEDSWGMPPEWYANNPPTYIWTGILHSPAGLAPKVSGIKVGFHVMDEVSSYVLQYALPHFFEIETTLYRNVYVDLSDGEHTYFQLANLALDRARSPHIMFPGYPPLPLEKEGQYLVFKRYYKANFLQELQSRKTPGITDRGAPARVSFLYKPRTDSVLSNQGIFQISEIPSVLVTLRQVDRVYRLPQEWIRGYKCNYQVDRTHCDLEFEVVVVASGEEELVNILEKVRGKCEGDARIVLAPWGASKVVTGMSKVDRNPTINAMETQSSAGFNVKVTGCPDATYKKKI